MKSFIILVVSLLLFVGCNKPEDSVKNYNDITYAEVVELFLHGFENEPFIFEYKNEVYAYIVYYYDDETFLIETEDIKIYCNIDDKFLVKTKYSSEDIDEFECVEYRENVIDWIFEGEVLYNLKEYEYYVAIKESDDDFTVSLSENKITLTKDGKQFKTFGSTDEIEFSITTGEFELPE